MATFKSKVREFLKNNTIDILEECKEVIQIDSKMPVYEAFQTLIEKNILSAPVWDDSEKKYLGFLDIRDLVSWVVFVFDEQKVDNDTRLWDLIKYGLVQFKMSGTDGVSVSYLCRRHKFSYVEPHQPLNSLVQLLIGGMHRVPVVKDGKVVNIVSQSTIITAITQHVSGVTFDRSDDKTIGELDIGTRKVLSVNKNTSVIDTFRQMEHNNLSGIAILDGQGRIIGTTTGKDLGLFVKNPTLASLKKPIFEYLKEVRSQQINIRTPLITVFQHDKLTRAVALLSATKVHRVFVVDNEEHFNLVAVLSITDILRFVLA